MTDQTTDKPGEEPIQETIDKALKNIFEMMDREVAKWEEGSFGHSLALQIATNNRNILLQMDEFFKSDKKLTGVDRLASQVVREVTIDSIDSLKALGAIADLRAALG